MAKIHTVEWTPGIVNTPALWLAMNVNWSGGLGQTIKDRFGRLGASEILSGIMGSPQEHHEARFQLTEEFVSVYRMHPLVRDDWNIFDLETGRSVWDWTPPPHFGGVAGVALSADGGHLATANGDGTAYVVRLP